MAENIFKLSGIVDIVIGRAEANLRRLFGETDRTRRGLDELDRAGRSAGAGLGGSFDRAATSAGRFGAAVSGLSAKMGGLRGVASATGSAFAGLGTELLTGSLSKLTATFSLAIKTGIDFNKMMEGAGIVFENLAGSAEGAQRHLNDLKEFAKSSPFDLPDLIQASARMQAFGFGIASVVPNLRNLQNAAALAAGTSGNFTESLDGIVRALGQMRAGGRVSAEEMGQFAERGIPAWDLLAQKIGKTVGETRALSEAGRLNGAAAADALIEAFGEGKFAGLGEKLAKTTLGKESNLRDALTQQAGAAAVDTVAAYNNALDAALLQSKSPMAASIGQRMNAPVAAGLQIGADVMSGATTAKDIGRALVPTAIDTVKDLTKILSEGIAGAWQVTKEVATGVAEAAGISMGQGAIKGTRDALQSRSPSKVYEMIGGDAAEGFVIGFENGKKRIMTANEKLVEELRKQYQRAITEFATGFEEASKRTGIPKELLMGVASRETNMRNILGDGGRGAGVMQVDIGTDAAFKASGAWKDATASIIRGAEILQEKFEQLIKLAGERVTIRSRKGERFSFTVPELAGDDLTRTGVAAYNSGMFAARNAALGRSVDASTTGRDYSADVLRRAEIFRQLGQQTAAIEAPAKAATLQLGNLAGAVTVLGQSAQGDGPRGPIQGGGVSVDVVGQRFDPIRIEQLTTEFTKLDTTTRLAKAATEGLPPALGAATAKTRDWASEIITTSKTTEQAIDVLAGIKDALGRGFNDLFSAIMEGGGRWVDAGKRLIADFFRSTLNAVFTAASGGKANSPGQFLGNALGGLLGGGQMAAAGGGANGGGGFLTGGFAGGNPAQAILGGGGGSGSSGFGGLGGLLRRIPGLGRLFGGGAKSIGGLPTITRPDVFNPALGGGGSASGAAGAAGGLGSLAAGGLLMGGGLLGGALGKGPIGKLMGSLGGTLALGAAGSAGLFGGGMAAALPAFFSNPFTAIIGGALLGGALLSRLLGDKTLKSLRGLIRGEYGIEVKANQVLENVKALGESKFGKEFRKRQIETVRLPEVKDLLSEYAARTGQKGNSRLVSSSALRDEFDSRNQFTIPRREMGGPVIAGQAYLVGERRPEVFVPSTSGQILPSVPQGGRGIVPTGGEDGKYLLEVLEELTFAVGRLQGIPAGQIVQQGLEERPGIAARDVRRAFDHRSEDANLIRERMERR